MNATTRRYFRELLASLPEYSWLGPIRPKLEDPAKAQAAASQIRARDLELDSLLHTTVVPTGFPIGTQSNGKVNATPTTAEAIMDVRRLPSESAEDALVRLRQIVNDPAVSVNYAPGTQPPATDPSSRTTPVYSAMQRAINRVYPRDAVVTSYMSRGSTDSSFLRARGIPMYGVPLFLREPGESRAHGNDERIATKTLDEGVESAVADRGLKPAGEN